MNYAFISKSGVVLAAAALCAACGGAPPPVERLAGAEAAARSARELGAEKDPKAALHLKLATEQIDAAKAFMKDDDNKKAAATLAKASADAELSLQLAKEAKERVEADRAKDAVKNVRSGR